MAVEMASIVKANFPKKNEQYVTERRASTLRIASNISRFCLYTLGETG
jgi:hypothetical protein